MLSEGNTGMYMPVAPAYAGGNGFGNGFGGDWAWIILLLLLGWGNNGWGNGGFGGYGNDIYPWMNQANLTSNGFQNQMLNDNVTSIRDGIHSLSTQLCNTGSDIQMALANGFSGVEQGANTRQMADMQQMFSLQSALQNCCCENRAGLADLKYTVATEACADRTAVTDALRDVIASNTANTQAILDKLCQQEIDALKAQNQQLQMQGYLASLAASQNAQTGQILTDNAAQTTALLRALNPAPIPAYVVPNPFGCNCGYYNNGCGGNGFYN